MKTNCNYLPWLSTFVVGDETVVWQLKAESRMNFVSSTIILQPVFVSLLDGELILADTNAKQRILFHFLWIVIFFIRSDILQ